MSGRCKHARLRKSPCRQNCKNRAYKPEPALNNWGVDPDLPAKASFARDRVEQRSEARVNSQVVGVSREVLRHWAVSLIQSIAQCSFGRLASASPQFAVLPGVPTNTLRFRPIESPIFRASPNPDSPVPKTPVLAAFWRIAVGRRTRRSERVRPKATSAIHKNRLPPVSSRRTSREPQIPQPGRDVDARHARLPAVDAASASISSLPQSAGHRIERIATAVPLSKAWDPRRTASSYLAGDSSGLPLSRIQTAITFAPAGPA